MAEIIEPSKKISKKSHGNRLLTDAQERAVAGIIRTNLKNKKIKTIKDVQEIILKYYNENRGSSEAINKVGQTTAYDILKRTGLSSLYRARTTEEKTELIVEDPINQKLDIILSSLTGIKEEIKQLKESLENYQKHTTQFNHSSEQFGFSKKQIHGLTDKDLDLL